MILEGDIQNIALGKTVGVKIDVMTRGWNG